MMSKPTGLMQGVGAESREETWPLSMTIMRTVSYTCDSQAVGETVLYTFKPVLHRLRVELPEGPDAPHVDWPVRPLGGESVRLE